MDMLLHPIISFPKFWNSCCQNAGISVCTKDRKFRNSEIPELQSLAMKISYWKNMSYDRKGDRGTIILYCAWDGRSVEAGASNTCKA